MIITARDESDAFSDLFPTPTPSILGGATSIPIDNTPLPAMAMIAIKIYAFGGLGFMFCVVISAILYWFWTVAVKREWADSPGWLDLHPERMREREKARIARLKALKEERLQEKKRREQMKFTPPPLRYQRKDGRSRATSMPVKSAIRKSSMLEPRKSSLQKISSSKRSSWGSTASTLNAGAAAIPTKSKKVSWASCASTLDVDGNCTEKPLASKDSPSSSFEPPVSVLPPTDNYPISMPQAHTSTLRGEARPRSYRALVKTATTTPEVAFSWAKPPDHVPSRCTCANIDPLDVSNATCCEMHPVQN